MHKYLLGLVVIGVACLQSSASAMPKEVSSKLYNFRMDTIDFETDETIWWLDAVGQCIWRKTSKKLTVLTLPKPGHKFVFDGGALIMADQNYTSLYDHVTDTVKDKHQILLQLGKFRVLDLASDRKSGDIALAVLSPVDLMILNYGFGGRFAEKIVLQKGGYDLSGNSCLLVCHLEKKSFLVLTADGRLFRVGGNSDKRKVDQISLDLRGDVPSDMVFWHKKLVVSFSTGSETTNRVEFFDLNWSSKNTQPSKETINCLELKPSSLAIKPNSGNLVVALLKFDIRDGKAKTLLKEYK